jgi:hypothetical protein
LAGYELFGADRPGGSEPGEHPLMPALRSAKQALPLIKDLSIENPAYHFRQAWG